MLIEHLFDSREELYNKTAERCLSLLQSGLEHSGKASLIVPGGTTPAPVFKQLSKQNIDWENIHIALSDERWLDASHPQSNEKLIKKTLLINYAEKASFTGMKNAHNSTLAGEFECNETYQNIPTPIDAVMLGMGPDGHFASLFPRSEQINEALNPENKKLCMAINAEGCAVAGEYTKRMSMTLAALLNSKTIILLLTGEEKLQVLRQSSNLHPVTTLIKQSNTDVELYWAP